MLKLKNWLFGIIGATIVGFHSLIMLMISENAFKKKEKWAYKAMVIGILSWFFIDTALSYFYGAVFNILIINIPAIFIITLPLIVLYREYKSQFI